MHSCLLLGGRTSVVTHSSRPVGQRRRHVMLAANNVVSAVGLQRHCDLVVLPKRRTRVPQPAAPAVSRCRPEDKLQEIKQQQHAVPEPSQHESSCSNSSRPSSSSSKFQVVLTYEIDGQAVSRQNIVDLMFFPGKNSVRINNHKAYDIFEGKLLVGWRRDAQGRLVAILRSKGSNSTCPAASSQPQQRRDIFPPVSVTDEIHALQEQQQYQAFGAHNPYMQDNAQHAQHGEGVTRPAGGGIPSVAVVAAASIHHHAPHMQDPLDPRAQQDNLMLQIHTAGMHMLSSSAAGATAIWTAVGGAMTTLGKRQHDSAALERARTYVPSRLRPVMSEIYVPFGMWRDLFDGSERPFPKEGVPIRIMVTGAVQIAEQQTIMIRRITPYGYYVLRGIRGLSKLKGKLMVRWSLLMNGVIEMEVVNPPPPQPGTAAARIAHGNAKSAINAGNTITTGTASNNIVTASSTSKTTADGSGAGLLGNGSQITDGSNGNAETNRVVLVVPGKDDGQGEGQGRSDPNHN